MSQAKQEKPVFRMPTPDDDAEFLETQRAWSRIGRPVLTESKRKGRAPEHKKMEEVFGILQSEDGRKWVEEWLEHLEKNGSVREYGLAEVEARSVELNKVLPDVPDGYLLMVSSNPEVGVRLARHVGSGDPIESIVESDKPFDLNEALKTQAQIAKLEQILRGKVVDGTPETYTLGFDGRILKFVVVEILVSDQIVDEDLAGALAIINGLLG